MPRSFSIHPMYAFLFVITNRKCFGVAVLIRRDDNYAFSRADIRADGRGVAIWFSLAGTPLLAISLYLRASGPREAYEPIFQWARAHILAVARYRHVVFGDINQNSGRAPHFRHSFSDMRRLFSDSLEEASLRRVRPRVELPTWVGAQGYFNVLNHFLVSSHLPPVRGETHPDAHFPWDHCPITLQIPSVAAPEPITIL